MNYEAFVRSLTENLPEGLVMDNPGRGTSTVMWCDGERICYKRGRGARLYVDLRHLYEGYRQHAGRRMTTNDLKVMAPGVFDSKQNGHSCHCTFLFMALRRMDVVDEVQGAGRAGDPFWVSLPARQGTPNQVLQQTDEA